MHTPAIGKQLLHPSIVVLLALALMLSHAACAQLLTFDTTTVLTSNLNPALVGDAITFTAIGKRVGAA